VFDREAVDRHWPVIRYATNKAWGTLFEGEYGSREEVLALALEVANDRHALWDAGTFPPGRDLEIHLQRKIRDARYARGWRQAKDPETGKRAWVTHGLDDRPFGSFGRDDSDGKLADLRYEPYRVLYGHDEGEAYALATDWPAFTPRQRRRFADYMYARYPEACQAFEDLDRETKPPRIAWARWESERELRRARLRVTYARELAEARFAVTYGLAA
jgi:hypothetical protein